MYPCVPFLIHSGPFRGMQSDNPAPKQKESYALVTSEHPGFRAHGRKLFLVGDFANLSLLLYAISHGQG